MKKFLIAMVGTALAGSLAFAQQETTQEEVTEYGEEVGQQATEELQQHDPTQTDPEMQDPTQMETEDPIMGEESQTDESTWGQQAGMPQGVADMSAEELQGMTVVTEDGEEVGEIDQVGQSEEHQDRVVTVNVGGFLGVAEKTIAIPVSELEVGSDGNIKTTLSKESIQGREAFDEQGFTPEGETQSTESTY